MTRLTTESTLVPLATFIDERGGFGDGSEQIDRIADQTPYVEKRDAHKTCRQCGANITRVSTDNEVEIICSEQPNEHVYTLAPSDVFTHRLNPGPVLEDIANELGYDGVNEVISGKSAYVLGSVSDRIRIALVRRTDAHERVLDDLVADAIKNGRVNAVFTPTRFEDMKWGSVLRKPLAVSAPPFPLEFLSESPNNIRRQIDSAAEVHDRREHVLSQAGADTDLLRHLNQNPRAIQLELEYAPLFRAIDTPNSGRLSDRFEEVCATAFEAIDFPSGKDDLGTDSRGENLADILFSIGSDSRYPANRGGGKILGIVDAKSNAEADIGKEQIIEKHAEYLQHANTDAFDQHHIAHVFIVLSMKGYEANEIDWYDAIEANVHGANVDDITMVVLYADALAHILDIHLSAVQRNEANLAVSDIQDVFRPFFNYRAFKRGVDDDIQQITRVDDRDPNAHEEEYRDEYRQRERLLVVTREMVDKHYRRTIDEHDMLGGLLSKYGDTL